MSFGILQRIIQKIKHNRYDKFPVCTPENQFGSCFLNSFAICGLISGGHVGSYAANISLLTVALLRHQKLLSDHRGPQRSTDSHQARNESLYHVLLIITIYLVSVFFFFSSLLRKLVKSGCAFSIKCKGAEHLLISYFHLTPCHTTCAGNWIGAPLYQNNLLTSFPGRCRMEIYFSH